MLTPQYTSQNAVDQIRPFQSSAACMIYRVTFLSVYQSCQVNYEHKRKIAPAHAMKAFGGSRCLAPIIFYLSTG